MQSTVGLVFRALVMLACLALVPLLAIYGKQLPDFYKAVVDAYKARTQQNSPDALAQLGSDAPAWAPTNDRSGSNAPPAASAPAANGSAQVGPATGAPAAWNNNAGQMARPLDTTNGSPAASAGAVLPASFAVPVDSGKPADPTSALSQAPLNQSPSAPAPDKTAEPQPTGAPDTCSAQFRHIEQRLRELGSTYYFLETYGDGYRFFCRVALTGNSDSVPKYDFQAMNADPLNAMKSVMDQVELWRSGRAR